MDATDKKLIALLQENGKLTMKELSQRLGLSITPIYERLKRLEKRNIILGYQALINAKNAGFELEVFCSVTLESHKASYLNQFKQDIQKFNEVMECYHVAGSFDFLVKILVKNMDDYSDFVNSRLAKLDNVGQVQSLMVLDTVKHKNSLPFG